MYGIHKSVAAENAEMCEMCVLITALLNKSKDVDMALSRFLRHVRRALPSHARDENARRFATRARLRVQNSHTCGMKLQSAEEKELGRTLYMTRFVSH